MLLKRKSCSAPLCPTVHTNPGSYCDKHRKPIAAKIQADKPSMRYHSIYDVKWRKESKAYLRTHPVCVCEECRGLYRPLPSNIVDHIVPHKGDIKVFWDKENWQAMNRVCHGRKTAEKEGRWGIRGGK